MAQNESTKEPGKGDTGLNNKGNKGIVKIPAYKTKRIIIPTVIILLAVAAAVYWYVSQLGFVSTDDAYIDSNKLSVSAKMLGRIVNLTVDEGDAVEAGQLLVQLDSTDLKAREKQWREVASSERASGARVDALDAEINRMQQQIASLESEIDELYQQRSAIHLG